MYIKTAFRTRILWFSVVFPVTKTINISNTSSLSIVYLSVGCKEQTTSPQKKKQQRDTGKGLEQVLRQCIYKNIKQMPKPTFVH